VSDRQAFAAPGAPPLQDSSASPGAHPLPEPVDLLSAAVVRLKRALHVDVPRRERWKPFDTSAGVYGSRRYPVNLERNSASERLPRGWTPAWVNRRTAVAKFFVATRAVRVIHFRPRWPQPRQRILSEASRLVRSPFTRVHARPSPRSKMRWFASRRLDFFGA